jgi:hypothetical protein
MLAAQECMLHKRSVALREASEAKESRHSSTWKSSNYNHATSATSKMPDEGATMANVSEQHGEVAHLMDENAAKVRPQKNRHSLQPSASGQPLERTCELTVVLTGDLLDELARGYSQEWFQELVRTCAQECHDDMERFVSRLQDIAFEVQRPILKNWGFEDDLQGVLDVTSIILEHTGGNGREVPTWLLEKRDACLSLLYGRARA